MFKREERVDAGRRIWFVAKAVGVGIPYRGSNNERRKKSSCALHSGFPSGNLAGTTAAPRPASEPQLPDRRACTSSSS
jgi:hypothetical protein